jgi:NhaP-type Na+/H+ or K+/H+ antiporter
VSLLIGVVFGLLAAFITKYSEPVHVLEPIIVFAMGYLAYLLADAYTLSGIITNTAVGVQIHHEEGVRSKECTAYMIDENSTDSESKRAYKDDYTDLESL